MKRIFNKYSIFAIFILLYIIWGNLIFPTIMQGSFFDIWDENFISLERVLQLLFHTFLGIVFVFIGLFILYKFLPLKKSYCIHVFLYLISSFFVLFKIYNYYRNRMETYVINTSINVLSRYIPFSLKYFIPDCNYSFFSITTITQYI